MVEVLEELLWGMRKEAKKTVQTLLSSFEGFPDVGKPAYIMILLVL